ncbi:MAG: O-antigen ligase family protein [Patescibacteria group bacterium]|nr:O-antigen ligase family protein [Patescibacteria group bacterium]
MSKKKRNRHIKVTEMQSKDYSKYYLWIIKTGIVACLFLPLLIIPSHLYLMQVGRVIMFRIIIEIIAFFYILLIIKKPKYRPKWGIFEISISVFVLIFFITSITGVNFARSFWGTVDRMGGFFGFLHFWIYFVILISIFKTKKDWEKLFGISVFVAVISSFYAFGQSALFWRTILPWLETNNLYLYSFAEKFVTKENFITLNNWRPFGTIGNSGLFASYILFNLFFGLYLFFSKKKKFKKIIIFFLFSAVGGGILISGTRGAYLAVVGGLIIFTLLNTFFSSKKKVKVFTIGTLIVFVLLIGYVFSNKDSEFVKNNYVLTRLSSVSFGSGESRIWTWESSVQGLKNKTLLGYGPENYNVAFNRNFNPLHFKGYGFEAWYDRAHNIFFDIATTMGVIGLTSYLGIFIIIYLYLIKNRHRARENLPAFAMIFSLPVAYFVHNFFWFDDFSSYLMLFLFFAFVSTYFNEELKFVYNIEKGKNITESINNRLNLDVIKNLIINNKDIFLVLMGIFLIFTIYYANIKPWKFHKLTTTAVAAFEINAEDSFLWYKKAMESSTDLGKYEMYKHFGSYVVIYYDLKDSQNFQKRDEFKSNLKFSISEMEQAVSENDQDVRFYEILSALYNKYYRNFREIEYLEKAEVTLQKALELSPNRETIYHEYGQTMIFKKDYNKAIEFFQKGVELNSNVAVSHWYLGMAFINSGDLKNAKYEIEKAIELGYVYRNNINDILGITNIYIDIKDYAMLSSLYKDAIKLDPNNPQHYVSLAIVYKELGYKKLAKEMAEKAISLDESFSFEGQQFIESLN